MERNTLKHHSRSSVARSMKDINNINDSKFKDSWEYSGSSEGDLLSGFHPWPPRSYGCTFCKREFRSAQALGGHMNVHRRDRARLRQYSPPKKVDFPFLNLNLNNTNTNPNPKPNPSQNHGYPPLAPTLIPMGSRPSPSPSSLSALSSPSSASPGGIKKWVMLHSKRGAHVEKSRAAKSLVGVGKFDGLARDGRFDGVKNASGIVRLDLEIGLVADSKEDLDLELRLGRS